MPAPWLIPLVLRLSQWRSGARFDEVKPVDLIPKVSCPVMVISGEDDPFAPQADLLRLQNAISQNRDTRSLFWNVTGARHVSGLAGNPQEYLSRIAAFIEKC